MTESKNPSTSRRDLPGPAGKTRVFPISSVEAVRHAGASMRIAPSPTRGGSSPPHHRREAVPLRTLAAAAFLSTAAVLTAPVSAAEISTWDPSAAGILNMFGTEAFTDPTGGGGDPSFSTFNAEDTSFSEHIGAFAAMQSEATATPGEFAVKAFGFNERDVGSQPVSASAVAATNYFVPVLDKPPGGGDPDVPGFVAANLSLEGDFVSDSNGSFLFLDVRVDDRFPISVSIVHSSTGSFTDLTRVELGGTVSSENLGPWTGSRNFPFLIPASFDEETFGRLDMRLWMQIQSKGEPSSGGNLADFFGTASLTVEPPPGGFVGLATGLAFLPDAEVPEPRDVPEPPTALLLALAAGAILLGALRRGASLSVQPTTVLKARSVG